LGILPEDECDNSRVAQALSAWIAIGRQTGKTLIMLHHMRKGAGEHGEGIAGGHAMLGAVDIALEVRRDNQPNRRHIRGYCRLIQPPDLLYEKVEEGRLHSLGDPSGVSLVEVRRRVQVVLDGEWATTSEVLERLEEPKPGAELLRKALLAEAHAGSIERDPPLTEVKVSGRTVQWRLRLPPELG